MHDSECNIRNNLYIYIHIYYPDAVMISTLQTAYFFHFALGIILLSYIIPTLSKHFIWQCRLKDRLDFGPSENIDSQWSDIDQWPIRVVSNEWKGKNGSDSCVRECFDINLGNTKNLVSVARLNLYKTHVCWQCTNYYTLIVKQ